MPHDDHPHSHLPSDPALRVKALETLLTAKGLVDPVALDEIIDTYAHRIGPQNGARVVARAWADDGFRAALLEDADPLLAEMGLSGRQGEHVVVVENTEDVHNMVVCTLCSCYPWPLLGIPPGWYKSDAYRARAVREPRRVLAEFGVSLPEETAVRVWDSTAEIRYLVLPRRPDGTDGWSAERLQPLVTRDSMIGCGQAADPMTRVHDMGGRFGDGPVVPEPEDVKFHSDWHPRALALTLACGMLGQWNLDMRRAREGLAPTDYARFAYYEKWLAGLADMLVEVGLVTEAELAGEVPPEPSDRANRRVPAEAIPRILAAGGPASRDSDVAPIFQPGDRVRTRDFAENVDVPGGHTRLPAYAAGKTGRVVRTHGSHVLPDANAHGRGERPEPLYAVAFSAADLWAHPEHAQDEVILDLWQSYLSRA